MTAVATPPVRRGRPVALQPACDALSAALHRRMAAAGLDGPAPVAVPLGTVDVLRPHRDPASARRAGATLHLTPQAVLVGPWRPAGAGPAACGLCLDRRWQQLRPGYEREALEFAAGARPVAEGGWPVLIGHLVEAVWTVYRAALLDTTPAGPDGLPRVARIDVRTLAVQTVPILPDPLCPGCAATPAEAEPVPVLRSRPKPPGGGYRLRRPADYALPAAALANPVCGVIGPSARSLLASPTTAPVAGGTTTRGQFGLSEVNWSGQADSYGLSRDLALLEGLERYAGTRRRRPEPPLVDSYANLGDAALDPRTCGTYDPATYETDEQLSPFDPDRRMPWVPGFSLRDDRPVLVPSRLAYYSSGTTADNFVFECSNGCASGGSLEEAILFGLLELIERDAFLLAWYGSAELTELDVSALRSPGLHAMLDRAELLGYHIRLFDNRIDLPVPAVTGVAIRRDGGPGALSFAAGCSLDPGAAASAALSEILTYLPSLAHQARTRGAELRAMARDYTRVRMLRDHAALFTLPEMTEHAPRYLRPVRTLPFLEVYEQWQVERPETGDLLDDLAYVRDALVRRGFDVIVVEQTAPEQRRSGVSSVSVIVPGLLPIDFGWSRQRALRMPRMFTAQRAGGLCDTDLTAADLHLVPHPFP